MLSMAGKELMHRFIDSHDMSSKCMLDFSVPVNINTAMNFCCIYATITISKLLTCVCVSWPYKRGTSGTSRLLLTLVIFSCFLVICCFFFKINFFEKFF